MQQYRGTLDVIDRVREKIRVKRHYLKREIRRCVGAFFRDRGVEPVVIRPIDRKIVEQSRLARKTLFPEHAYRLANGVFLLDIERRRRNDEREIESDHDSDTDHCADRRPQQDSLAGRTAELSWFVRTDKFAVTALASHSGGTIDEAAIGTLF